MSFLPTHLRTECLLTCLFRSSIIRAIWIFFLPILATFECFLFCHKCRLLCLLCSTFRSSVSLFPSKLLASTKQKEKQNMRVYYQRKASLTDSTTHMPVHGRQEEDKQVLELCGTRGWGCRVNAVVKIPKSKQKHVRTGLINQKWNASGCRVVI